MTPFVKDSEELAIYTREDLISHINWLYRYIEEIKQQLRNARIKI